MKRKALGEGFNLETPYPSRLTPDALLDLHSHLFRLRDHFLNRADHVERLFREMVVFAGEDFLEASHRVFELHILAGLAGKGFGDVERL